MPHSTIPTQGQRRMDNFSLQEATSSSGLWALAFAFLGRLLRISGDRGTNFFRWSLLLELPTALALLYLAKGTADYIGWETDDHKTMALITLFCYLGPEGIERLVAKFLPLVKK